MKEKNARTFSSAGNTRVINGRCPGNFKNTKKKARDIKWRFRMFFKKAV